MLLLHRALRAPRAGPGQGPRLSRGNAVTLCFVVPRGAVTVIQYENKSVLKNKFAQVACSALLWTAVHANTRKATHSPRFPFNRQTFADTPSPALTPCPLRSSTPKHFQPSEGARAVTGGEKNGLVKLAAGEAQPLQQPHHGQALCDRGAEQTGRERQPPGHRKGCQQLRVFSAGNVSGRCRPRPLSSADPSLLPPVCLPSSSLLPAFHKLRRPQTRTRRWGRAPERAPSRHARWLHARKAVQNTQTRTAAPCWG